MHRIYSALWVTVHASETYSTVRCSEQGVNADAAGDLPQGVAHHARVLGLQGDEVAEWRQRRGLMRCHWRTRVQEEMLAGDQRWEGLVRHG